MRSTGIAGRQVHSHYGSAYSDIGHRQEIPYGTSRLKVHPLTTLLAKHRPFNYVHHAEQIQM